MVLYDIKFKIMFNDEYSKLTREFQFLKVFFWCNNEYDVIEIFMDTPEDYQKIKDHIPIPCSLIEEVIDENHFHLIIKNCSCCKEDNSVTKFIGDLNILHISPVILENGWEEHHVIVFEHQDFEEFVQRIEEQGYIINITRKVPFKGTFTSLAPLTRSTLFSHLTQKQISALILAYRSGYYRLPRRADVKTIALKENIARTTFQEHLRKAECKVISTMIPQLQLYFQSK